MMYVSTLLSLTVATGLAIAVPLAPRSTLWTPKQMTTWQIILSETVDASNTISPNVEVFDVDLFDTSKATIQTLKSQGKKVICYFSAGSYEPKRPDAGQFKSSDMGSVLDGWPDEKWLNLKSQNVKNIMAKRIQTAVDKGCDAVDPDNMDGYSNLNGLNLQSSDSVTFMKNLSSLARSQNLAIGLKNSLEIVPQLINDVQFAVNEQCHAYNECDAYVPLTKQNKPVFNIEYPDSAPSVNVRERRTSCGATGQAHLSTIIKTMDLDGWAQYCDASTVQTATA